jgi:hypothetical protein
VEIGESNIVYTYNNKNADVLHKYFKFIYVLNLTLLQVSPQQSYWQQDHPQDCQTAFPAIKNYKYK